MRSKARQGRWLVRIRTLDVVDDDEFAAAPGVLEFQAKLFLDRREDRGAALDI